DPDARGFDRQPGQVARRADRVVERVARPLGELGGQAGEAGQEEYEGRNGYEACNGAKPGAHDKLRPTTAELGKKPAGRPGGVGIKPSLDYTVTAARSVGFPRIPTGRAPAPPWPARSPGHPPFPPV